MKDLHLPIIKGVMPFAKRLSMNDYLKFVSLNLKYGVTKKINSAQRKLLAVNVPFSLKE